MRLWCHLHADNERPSGSDDRSQAVAAQSPLQRTRQDESAGTRAVSIEDDHRFEKLDKRVRAAYAEGWICVVDDQPLAQGTADDFMRAISPPAALEPVTVHKIKIVWARSRK